MTDVKHMKWWGWGNEGVGFHWEDKPGFADFVKYAVGLDLHTAAPVEKPESPLASQATMEPISSGVPKRLTGIVATIFSSTSGLMARTMSVPM